MIFEQNLDLNMIPYGLPPIVYISQFDDGDRKITFNLFNGESAYTPSSPKVMIGDNEIPCTFEGNSVSFFVPNTVTETPGLFHGEVIDADSLGSLNFNFRVDPTPERVVPIVEPQSVTLNLRPLTGLKPTLSAFVPIEEPVEEPIEEEVEDELVNNY